MALLINFPVIVSFTSKLRTSTCKFQPTLMVLTLFSPSILTEFAKVNLMINFCCTAFEEDSHSLIWKLSVARTLSSSLMLWMAFPSVAKEWMRSSMYLSFLWIFAAFGLSSALSSAIFSITKLAMSVESLSPKVPLWMAAPLSIRTFPFLTRAFGARNRALTKGRIPFLSKVEDTPVTEGGALLAGNDDSDNNRNAHNFSLSFSGQSAEARET